MTHPLEDAFISLVERHKKLIYKICFMYTETIDERSDYYQETLINLWKAYPNFQGNAQESTWVYRITLNTCLLFKRKKQRSLATIPLTGDIEWIYDDDEGKKIKELYHLINRLNAVEKAIIMLYLDRNSYDEIAIIIGTTANNVGVKLNRIREKLRNMSNQ